MGCLKFALLCRLRRLCQCGCPACSGGQNTDRDSKVKPWSQMDTSNSRGPNQAGPHPTHPPTHPPPITTVTLIPSQNRAPGLACRPQLWPWSPLARAAPPSRASDKLKIKARANKIRFKIFAAAKFRICCATRLRSPSRLAKQQCCLYHWNRRCVVRLNDIALFNCKFSSQYLCKTLILSLLIWKPILVLLDPQSNLSISFAD